MRGEEQRGTIKDGYPGNLSRDLFPTNPSSCGLCECVCVCVCVLCSERVATFPLNNMQGERNDEGMLG